MIPRELNNFSPRSSLIWANASKYVVETTFGIFDDDPEVQVPAATLVL